eukprot:351328-Chlamydomonas_euryale.AAC.10
MVGVTAARHGLGHVIRVMRVRRGVWTYAGLSTGLDVWAKIDRAGLSSVGGLMSDHGLGVAVTQSYPMRESKKADFAAGQHTIGLLRHGLHTSHAPHCWV